MAVVTPAGPTTWIPRSHHAVEVLYSDSDAAPPAKTSSQWRPARATDTTIRLHANWSDSGTFSPDTTPGAPARAVLAMFADNRCDAPVTFVHRGIAVKEVWSLFQGITACVALDDEDVDMTGLIIRGRALARLKSEVREHMAAIKAWVQRKYPAAALDDSLARAVTGNVGARRPSSLEYVPF